MSPKATKEIQTQDFDFPPSPLSPTLLDTTDQFSPPPSTSEPHSSESQLPKLVMGSTPKGSGFNVRSPVTSPTESLGSPMKSLGDTWSGVSGHKPLISSIELLVLEIVHKFPTQRLTSLSGTQHTPTRGYKHQAGNSQSL